MFVATKIRCTTTLFALDGSVVSMDFCTCEVRYEFLKRLFHGKMVFKVPYSV
jgi:hypothetical protein